MPSVPENNDTAQKILDEALALWSEKGYASSTMRELSRRIGMGLSSLYFYFRSKEEIVQFLYRQLNERARTKFAAEAMPGTSLGAEVQRFVEIKLEILRPHRPCLGALLREAID